MLQMSVLSDIHHESSDIIETCFAQVLKDIKELTCKIA